MSYLSLPNFPRFYQSPNLPLPFQLIRETTHNEHKMTRGTILVTGGAGYVGSHTILELLNAEYQVVVVDNMCNAHMSEGGKIPESLRRVQELTGRTVAFYNVDIRDRVALDKVFKQVRAPPPELSSFNLDSLSVPLDLSPHRPMIDYYDMGRHLTRFAAYLDIVVARQGEIIAWRIYCGQINQRKSIVK